MDGCEHEPEGGGDRGQLDEVERKWDSEDGMQTGTLHLLPDSGPEFMLPRTSRWVLCLRDVRKP